MNRRVLHIITCLSAAGAQRALYNILAGGVAAQGDAAVLSMRGMDVFGPRIQALGVPVYTLDLKPRTPHPGSILRLHKLVRDFDPDIVQGWMYHGNVAASVVARLARNRPAVAWNIRHCLYGLHLEKRMTQYVIRSNRYLSGTVDAIVYNSNVSRKQHEKFGFAAKRGLVIPNGFATDAMTPSIALGQSVRRDIGIPSDAFVVGHVARLHPMKDHQTFMRAAVQVVEKYPTTHVLMLGRDVHADAPILSGIVPDGLSHRFHMLGERSDVHDLMQAMDVLCLSSAWGEGFPNVLGEAMSLGVPCVATDVGDSADIVGETGRIAPPNDGSALARGIMELLDLPKEAREYLGRQARERIETKYSLPNSVALYKGLYEELGEKS